MSDIKSAIDYAKKNPNTAFASELRRRIESGQMNTELSSAGLDSYVTKPVAGKVDAVTPVEKPGFVENVKADAVKRNNNMIEAQKSDQGFGSKIAQTYGEGFGLVKDIGVRAFDSVLNTAKNIVKKIPGVEERIPVFEQGVNDQLKYFAETDAGKMGIEALSKGAESYNQFKIAHPEAAKNVEAMGNIVGGLATIIPALQGLKKAEGVAIAGKEIATNAIDAGVTKAAPILNTAKDIAIGTKDVVADTAKGLSSIPGRISANVSERKAINETLKETIKSKAGRKAVLEGIDMGDVQHFSDLPATQKTQTKLLVKAVRDFESGASKVRPEEAAGKPLINRINELKATRSKIGKRLGEVANNLGEVSEDQIKPEIFQKLRSVHGLEGLGIDEKGILNFDDTVLASAETATDRSAIQSIFNNASKSGTGKSKHLLRQELFESLGGKKAAGVQLTGTQENAYQAIRSGLSDVLDAQNPAYKKLNSAYQKYSSPLKKLTKILKIGDEKDEDILNLKAGTIMRRLTSNAPSGADIKSALNEIDLLSQRKGMTRTSVEHMQDTMNILAKYYDIAAKTGFQNLVKEGVDSGITNKIISPITDLAGKTNATRKKAFEKALDELLN